MSLSKHTDSMGSLLLNTPEITTPTLINNSTPTPLYSIGMNNNNQIQYSDNNDIKNTQITNQKILENQVNNYLMSTPTPSISNDLIDIATAQAYAGDLQTWEYSYYWPPLGGVNCRDFDSVNNVCRSPMASGDDWNVWKGKALACDSKYPIGTEFVIIAPAEVRGVWRCLDRGGLIDNTDYLDFLDDHQVLPWRTKIYGYVVK